MSDYCRQNLSSSNFKADSSWVILSEIEKRIKEKIEKVGKPLKDWDIKILRYIEVYLQGIMRLLLLMVR